VGEKHIPIRNQELDGLCHGFNPCTRHIGLQSAFGDSRFSFDRSLSMSIVYVLWKLEKNLCCGSLIFFNFSALASSNSAIILAARCSQKPIFLRLTSTERMTPVQIIYLTDPLKWNLKVGLQRIIFNIFELTTTEAMLSCEDKFVKIRVTVVSHTLCFRK